MPTSYWDWLREDAAAYRSEEWQRREFKSSTALFTKDGRCAKRYLGEEYDRTQFELRHGGWDHEHCRFCLLCICDSDPDHQKTGYTNGDEWLCETCYTQIIHHARDPESVLREQGWQ